MPSWPAPKSIGLDSQQDQAGCGHHQGTLGAGQVGKTAAHAARQKPQYGPRAHGANSQEQGHGAEQKKSSFGQGIRHDAGTHREALEKCGSPETRLAVEQLSSQEVHRDDEQESCQTAGELVLSCILTQSVTPEKYLTGQDTSIRRKG